MTTRPGQASRPLGRNPLRLALAAACLTLMAAQAAGAPAEVGPLASPARGVSIGTVVSTAQANLDAARQAVADAQQAVTKARAMVVTPQTPWQTVQQKVIAANQALVAAKDVETKATMVLNGARQAELDQYDARAGDMAAVFAAQNAALSQQNATVQAQRAGP